MPAGRGEKTRLEGPALTPSGRHRRERPGRGNGRHSRGGTCLPGLAQAPARHAGLSSLAHTHRPNPGLNIKRGEEGLLSGVLILLLRKPRGASGQYPIHTTSGTPATALW